MFRDVIAKVKLLIVISRRIHRNQQGLRRSPGSSESGKQMFNSPSSSSSSSSEGRQGRSPTPNPFRRGNPTRQHQSARANQASPESHQSRVRRSRSLQLPEKRSPGTTGPQRDHSRESNEGHRVVVKIVNDRGNDRSKRHMLQNSEYFTITYVLTFVVAHVYQIFAIYEGIYEGNKCSRAYLLRTSRSLEKIITTRRKSLYLFTMNHSYSRKILF